MTTNTFDIEKFAKEIGFTFIGRGRKSGTIAVRCDKCLGEKEYYKNSFKRRKEGKKSSVMNVGQILFLKKQKIMVQNKVLNTAKMLVYMKKINRERNCIIGFA